MADESIPADAARAMRTMTRQEEPDAATRGRFGRDVQAPPERVEAVGYEIDPDAVAAAIIDRLLAGRALRARGEDA
jgi:hypothetical protein